MRHAYWTEAGGVHAGLNHSAPGRRKHTVWDADKKMLVESNRSVKWEMWFSDSDFL